MTPDQTNIAIMGEDVPAHHERIPIDRLRFLPGNPRVYAAIRGMQDFDGLTPDEKQQRIYERLLQEPSVKNLIPEIQRTVDYKTRSLSAGTLRKSSKATPAWLPTASSMIGPTTTGGHISAAWSSQLLRMINRHAFSARHIFTGRLTGPRTPRHCSASAGWSRSGETSRPWQGLSSFSPAEIKKNVKIIELMQENDDNALSNFSYYNVLVRSRTISSAVEDSEPLRDTLLSQIKTAAFTAQEMRERLPTIIAKPRILRKYEKGDVTLEDAYDRAKISGAEQQLKKIPRRPGRHRARRHRTLGAPRTQGRTAGRQANQPTPEPCFQNGQRQTRRQVRYPLGRGLDAMTKKNVLLVEPGYPNKYPPLGLMKIAAYHGPNGRGDNVRFVKGENPEVLAHVWDRVYVTTLFSFEWKRTAVAIDFALRAVRGQAERVFVGGIAASLMFDEFVREPRWAGIRFIRGLLDQPPGRLPAAFRRGRRFRCQRR